MMRSIQSKPFILAFLATMTLMSYQHSYAHDNMNSHHDYMAQQFDNMNDSERAKWKERRKEREQERQKQHQAAQNAMKAACQGKTVGQAVTVNVNNRSIKGTCHVRYTPTPAQKNTWQAEKQERKQKHQAEHQARHQALENACKGKKIGQAVTVNFNNHTIQGTCDMGFTRQKS